MNTFSANLYNNLPTITSAMKAFPKSEQEETLLKLIELLSRPEYKEFGVCLVHRHCVLEDGERMVARGLVSQPEIVGDSEVHAERWLSTGEAYEFNEERSTAPPPILLEEFRNIAGKHAKTLGVYFIHDPSVDGVPLERTEGRKNITEIVQYHSPRRSVTTGWRADGKPKAKVRVVECASCALDNNSHIQNGGKLEVLQERTGLGHVIHNLQRPTDDVQIQ